MDNQIPQQPKPNSPTPTQPPAPAPAPSAAAQPQKPAGVAVALPKDQSKSNKKLVIGCISAFGCSLLLFVGVLFAFLAFGSTDNPIFGFLGVPPGEVVNVLITIVNLIFLVLVFAAFIFVVIGIFKITTARKDDKDARRKGTMFTFGALAIMILLIFIWIFAYFFLAPKRTTAIKTPIITEPVKTTGLTAPITVKFDASKASVNKKTFDILSYDWNFDDGATARGNPQTHTFTDLGNFKVKLTITLKEKTTQKEQTVEFTRDVTIQNKTADVLIKADPQKGVAPLAVDFDGSDSKSPNGEITAYAWDLDEDGTFDDGDEATATYIYEKVGTYKVSLRVTDSTGALATNSIEIEVTVPDTPVPAITVEGVEGDELELNKPYVFSGASSTSPTGKIEKYTWDFGDNGKAATRSATHIYKEAGDYDVVLTVTDSSKKQGQVTKRFKVKAPAQAPLPSLKTTPQPANGVVSGQAPFDVIFDASASQDANDDIVEYAWDFDGDGKTDDANAVTSHKFLTAGNFNVSLTVTDSDDLFAKAQVVVKVDAAGLRADIAAEPVSGVVPLTVKFDASGSSYPEGRIVNFEWDFGDGAPPRTDASKVSYQYTAVGTFTAKVTAITQDNKRAAAQVSINVRPVPVKACFEPSVSSGKAPLEVQFDPTCSTGTVVKYRWNFANLGRSTDRKPKFEFKDPGAYDISLEVADTQNVVDTFTGKITVEAK
ncbi:PKD domain-containing protein [Candidatus Peregrinibacteria bacterium]|nr:PKD domain-containing protein [Candidatus Peregrinibacteria bacterium]